jgi:hypothetical protein
MKALTLHEPFASLIAYGWKEVETRDWYTSYRGPLAIHAALRKPDPTELSRLSFIIAARGSGFVLANPEMEKVGMIPLTFGAVVCVCQLVACLPAPLAEYKAKQLKEWFEPKHSWELERQFGDYGSGRWAWILRDVQRLDRPIAIRGNRKLWNWQAPLDLPTLRAFVTGIPSADVSTAPAISSPASKVGV